MNSPWMVKRDYAEEARFKRYAKKHGDEVAACFANLLKLRDSLNAGLTIAQALTFGFFGSEGEDVYRIGQTRVKHAKETRLYVYAKISGPDIQVLTIGDKDTQQEDIRRCHQIVRACREQEASKGGEQ